MTCTVEGCSKPRAKKTWCSMHYSRWFRYGDVHTTVKTPNGDAIRFLEQTVLTYEGGECLRWPFCCNKAGYAKIGQSIVARLVCGGVIGPTPSSKHEAAHSCNNGHEACVTKAHLSWKTRTENEADKIAHGTSNRGQRSGMAKLSDDEAREIKSLIGTTSLAAIARRFSVSPTTIWEIKTGKRWAWLHKEVA